MAVRVRVRIQCGRGKSTRFIETVAVANSGFEAVEPEILLPVLAAERLGLWPPPAGSAPERFESPGASFEMITLHGAVEVSLAAARHRTKCNAILAERETEVVLNDHLVDALRIQLVAPGRGLYRIGARGKLKHSESPEHW